MHDLGYNWSFEINLLDLEQAEESRKEVYYPICNYSVARAISKQGTKQLRKLTMKTLP